MHFRVRKNIIQLIRVNYDAGKKGGVNTVVGPVRLASPELSDEPQEALSPLEMDEFRAWLCTRHRAEVLREEMAALALVETLGLAERWFAREGDLQTARELSDDIVAQWHPLRRATAKRGLL